MNKLKKNYRKGFQINFPRPIIILINCAFKLCSFNGSHHKSQPI